MSWGRRRGGGGDWGGWPRYVPVAERREKAQKQAEKMRKKGQSLAPVEIAGRTIAATFWGKAWCENLERYGDYENRIPRGRTYVRNGSVVDLQIGTARVNALVSGSHLYSVEIGIQPLKPEVWKGIKGACTGRIGSLLELLQGKLSREVMEIVTKSRTGLFPDPAEISFRCSCPDWASMCKHVAAVLYGVGARLDREPELLFRLRDVDHRELIAAPGAADLAASPETREKIIAEDELAGIFGIEIDAGPAATLPAPETPKRSRKASSPMEKQEQIKPQRGRRSSPPKPEETAEQRKAPPRLRLVEPRDVPPRFQKAEKENAPPVKPRRGRPPLVRKETLKPKRGRPRLMPGAGEALRKEPSVRKRRTDETVPSQTKAVAKRDAAERKSAPGPEPVPARRRGRPPGKRKS